MTKAIELEDGAPVTHLPVHERTFIGSGIRVACALTCLFHHGLRSSPATQATQLTTAELVLAIYLHNKIVNPTITGDLGNLRPPDAVSIREAVELKLGKTE